MYYWLKNRFPMKLWPWVESIVISLLTLMATYYFHGHDPFFLQSTFAWIWFAPVIIALHYGVGPAILSLLIISAAFFMQYSSETLENTAYELYLLSGFILTILCGEFNTLWTGRVRRAELQDIYAEEVLNDLSREYYVVRLSHDRLEQNFINKPMTLRFALRDLRQLLIQRGGELTLDVAQRLLNLLHHYCSLYQVGLYVNTKKGIDPQPLAHVGPAVTLNLGDNLIQHSMDKKESSYIAVTHLKDLDGSDYLVSAPMRTSDGVLLGLIVVHDMPFMSLTKETLQILSILAGYFADEQLATKKSINLLKHYPECHWLFAAEMYRLTGLKKELNVDSVVTGIYVRPCQYHEEIYLHLQREHRGLDSVWPHEHGEQKVVFNLMPFSDSHSVSGYIQRIEASLKAKFGIDFTHPEIYYHFEYINTSDPLPVIQKLMGWVNER